MTAYFDCTISLLLQNIIRYQSPPSLNTSGKIINVLSFCRIHEYMIMSSSQKHMRRIALYQRYTTPIYRLFQIFFGHRNPFLIFLIVVIPHLRIFSLIRIDANNSQQCQPPKFFSAALNAIRDFQSDFFWNIVRYSFLFY